MQFLMICHYPRRQDDIWRRHCFLVKTTTGQGYNPPPDLNMGSKKVSERLKPQLERSAALRNTWPRGGQTSCKKTATLCAPAGINDFEAAATLWLALSPPAFYSTNSTDTGGVSVIAPAQDQQGCNTCTALAVVAAAQAAVATTLQLDVDNVLMSAQVG